MNMKSVKEACVVSILISQMFLLKASNPYALNINKGVIENSVQTNEMDCLNKKTYKVKITYEEKENCLFKKEEEILLENEESNCSSIDDAISISSLKYGVDEKLIKSLIKQESNFDPNCVSFMGAIGLMQIMPNTIKKFNVNDPYDIYENVDAGTRHLKGMIERYEGDIVKAIAAYNCGGNALDKSGFKSLEDVSMLPNETRIHVTKVFYYYNNLF